MSKQMARSRYGVVAIFLLAIASATAAHAEARGFTRDCALSDLAAVTWVEEQAEKRAMAPALLAEAAFAVLRARNACIHGKVAEALELYESVLVSVNGRKRL